MKFFPILGFCRKICFFPVSLVYKDLIFDILSGLFFNIFMVVTRLLLRIENIYHLYFSNLYFFFYCLFNQENLYTTLCDLGLCYDICSMFYQYYQRQNRYITLMFLNLFWNLIRIEPISCLIISYVYRS